MGGANVGACFRLFDSEPAARPNSFDLVATGEYATGQPEGVEGNVVFGFWREGVVGEMSTADVAAFYASNDVAPAVEPRDADLSAAPPSSRWSTTRPTTACTKRASLTVMCASSAR